MGDHHADLDKVAEFDVKDGLYLALAYLDDPSDVKCPKCGPGKIEVVGFLDSAEADQGRVTQTSPDGDYTAVLYCHGCERGAALDLSRDYNTGGAA